MTFEPSSDHDKSGVAGRADRSVSTLAQLDAVFANSPLPAFVRRNRDDTVIAANAACLSMLGWEPDEFVGHVHLVAQSRTQPDGTPIVVLTNGGDERLVVLWSHDLVVDGEGCCLVLMHDVTDRERMQAGLEQNEQMLREFLDLAPAFISARDSSGRLVMRNERYAARFLRADAGPGSHEPRMQLANVEDRLLEWGSSLERRVIETGAPISAEMELAELDGTASIYEFTKFPLRTPAGDFHGVGTIAIDVTAARRARDELRAGEERFREMAENLDEVFLLWEEGTLDMLYVSPAVERVIGVDAATFANPEARLAVVHPDDRELAASAPAPVKEFRIIKPDGAMRWIRTRTSSVAPTPGSPNRGVTTMVDFTDQKLAELDALHAWTQAETANLAKSEFLSRMSHELRTPLNAILGFGQLLQMDSLGAEQRQSVEHIIRAGQHLLGLIDEVLDISRVEAGQLRLSLEPVSVRDVIEEAITMTNPIAGRRDVSLVVVPGFQEVHVRADRQRFTQVLLNLLANAVKYNREGGEARVHAELLDASWLRLTVADTGIGIAGGDLHRLFQPFERLSAEHSAVEGTGLGLALTKHLVGAMGGRVGVASTEGVGSSFWIELPLADAPLVTRPERSDPVVVPPSSGSGQAKTILYVEDNLSNVRLVERVVERRPGVALMVAMQGRLALELAAAHRPDLILLDLHLPDMSGEAVLLALRSDPRTALTPIFVLSADATTGRSARLVSLGATEYFTKPFDIPRLLSAIDALDIVPREAEHPSGSTRPPADGIDDEAAGLAPTSSRALKLAHDYNNALGVILNYCDLLARSVIGDDAVSDLNEIRGAAAKAVELTKELAAFTD